MLLLYRNRVCGCGPPRRIFAAPLRGVICRPEPLKCCIPAGRPRALGRITSILQAALAVQATIEGAAKRAEHAAGSRQERSTGGADGRRERFRGKDSRSAPPKQGIDHSMYAALKIKDAIVDRLRREQGERPNVDKENPDIVVHAHFSGGRCTLSLDATGSSLQLNARLPPGGATAGAAAQGDAGGDDHRPDRLGRPGPLLRPDVRLGNAGHRSGDESDADGAGPKRGFIISGFRAAGPNLTARLGKESSTRPASNSWRPRRPIFSPTIATRSPSKRRWKMRVGPASKSSSGSARANSAR